MNLKPFPLVALLALGAVPVSASTHVSVGVSVGVPAPVIVRQAPPRRVSEAMIVAPGPGLVWVAGHYSWNNQWVWVPGAWVTPPQPGAVWVEGRWDQATQTWTEGHWQVAAPVVVATPPPTGTIVITAAPPPIRIEHRGHRPGRGHVWVSGYWGHDRHGHYVWVPGHWTVPPRGHRHWVAPRWEHRGGTYLFIEGRWN